jgi:hypothetical protein
MVLTNLVMEPAGALPRVWIAAFVLGNALALVFMIKASLTTFPSAVLSLRQAGGALLPRSLQAQSKVVTSPAAREPASVGSAWDKTPPSYNIGDVECEAGGFNVTSSKQHRHPPVLFEWQAVGCVVTSTVGPRTILQVRI